MGMLVALEDLRRLVSRLNTTDVQTWEVAHALQAHAAPELFRRLMAGQSYGEASGAPAHLTLPQAAFENFLKDTDNDLSVQVGLLSRSIDGWFAAGEVVPPYPAWRVAVILRKNRLDGQEIDFLRAYCRHFAQGQRLDTTNIALRDRLVRLEQKAARLADR
jgi:hypothetical protein